MFESIWKDVKYQVQTGNMVTRLVIINVAVFVAVNLVWAGCNVIGGDPATSAKYYDAFLHWISLSSSPLYTLTHIWVVITHMFVHEGFFHVLFNMLFLYWFGNIMGDLIGDKKIFPLYLLGGLAGALAYMLAAQFMAVGGIAMGASAAVMAIVVASAMVAPEYSMRLLFIGDVKLKWIAAAVVLIDLVQATGNSNAGGHVAHLGGAVMGFLFISNLNVGRDLSIPINNILDKLIGFFGEKKLTVAYKNKNLMKRNQRAHAVSDDRLSNQDRLDAILDKIKLKGYESLSETEKKFLAEESKK